MPFRLQPYRFFEVTGIELEYPVVDEELRPRCLVEDLFHAIARRPTSEAEYRETVFSNELAAHVFEIKTRAPERSMLETEAHLVEGLRYVLEVLRERFGARLLPTGMHPFMRPSDSALWPRAGRAIYQTYARLFPIQGHGWMNVQSCHINLPFGSEQETMLLHNAISCVMPYLPALCASSPAYEGALGPFVDNRLAFYRTNQRRIPHISGEVVPEFMESYAQYRRDILGRIYQKLDRIKGAARLRHEWVNSRGAIMRFSRRAIEIRTLDSQECVKMDVAIASFVRALLRRMVAWLREGRLTLPAHKMLVSDFDRVVEKGGEARVSAEHLTPWPLAGRGKRTAQRVLLALLDAAGDAVPKPERLYLPLVEQRLRQGNLSETIRRQVRKSGGRSAARQRAVLGDIYRELAGCLDANTPWRL